MLEVENSPGIHITVLTKDEQEEMQLDKIAEVWKDEPINFKIKGVSFFHKMKEGRKKLDCCLNVTSSTIEGIRRDLGLNGKDAKYNMHITCSEMWLEPEK